MSVKHLTGLWSKKALHIGDKKDDMVFTFCSCIEKLFENYSGSWILATRMFEFIGGLSPLIQKFYCKYILDFQTVDNIP